MNEVEIRANAMLQELSYQRQLLGDRCANLAAQVALLMAENEELKKKLSEPSP